MKWKDLSYKTKNKIFLWGFCLFLVLAYVVSISDTVELYFKNSQIKRSISLAENAPKQISVLKGKLESINLNFINSNNEGLRNELLNDVGASCDRNEVIFKNLQEPVMSYFDDLIIETFQVELKGDYINILKVIHEIEDSLATGKLRSVKFYLAKERRSNKESLQANLFVQSIKKLNDASQK